jgi:hypothetical protein
MNTRKEFSTVFVEIFNFVPVSQDFQRFMNLEFFQESSVYLLKYRAILTRALDMIRSFVK